jgi:two-component system LytT family sensor kinase
VPSSEDRPGPPLPPWFLISMAWSIPAVLAGFERYLQATIYAEPVRVRDVFYSGFDWFLYALLTPLVLRAGRRFPLHRPHVARHVGIHVLGALVLCVAWASLGTALRLVMFPMPPVGTALRDYASWILTTLPFGVAIYFALVGIEHALFYFAEAREREMQAVRLAGQLAESRLGALRMQLNPHFLFNSLNAITVLVRDRNTAGAERMLDLLSDVLRQVLLADAAHETRLSTEVAFVERYLAIEQIRFSDRLQPRIAVDPEVREAVVPTFVLQPLVENALRHGIARKASAGVLDVTARRDGTDLVLTVRDDGPGLDGSPPPAGAGVGLANTRARLATLYGDRASVEVTSAPGGGTVATVRIPFRQAPSGGDDPGEPDRG